MSSWKRRMADAVGDALGLHILPKHRVGPWIEERYLGMILRELDVDCVFDVGANVGQFGQMLRRVGYSGTILSFEPAPETFASLSLEMANDPDWHGLNMALGETQGVLPFNVMKDTVFSSFRQPSATEALTFSDVNQVKQVLDVPVYPLAEVIDDLSRQHGFKRPFLKMDTQGFDLQVVAGAGLRLLDFVGLSSEIALRRLYEDTPDLPESIRKILDSGFDVVNLLPVHPDRILSPLEFNGYAVRRDLAAS